MLTVGDAIRALDVTSAQSATVFDQLKTGLEAPLSGMGLAFSSSLFGLAGSLILGFLELQASQAQNRFYNDLEDWLSTITDIQAGEGGVSVPGYLRLDIAGLQPPKDMQGRSLTPLLKGSPPDDWRTSFYYHYYEGPPAEHTVCEHYGVTDGRYKLIHYYKIDQWELFDLVNDPQEMHNLYGAPGQETITASLKAELAKLKKAMKDDDQFANEQPPNGVDGPAAKLRGK